MLGILGGGAVAAVLWDQGVKYNSHENSTQPQKAVLIINALLWSVLALVSLFGIIGTIMKRLSFVSLYSTMLFSVLGFNVVSGVLYIHTLFRDDTKQQSVDQCTAGSTETIKVDACKGSYDVLRIVVVIALIVFWLVLLYGCMIVANYVGQLQEEESLDERKTPAIGGIPIQAPPPGPSSMYTNAYGAYQQQETTFSSYPYRHNSFDTDRKI